MPARDGGIVVSAVELKLQAAAAEERRNHPGAPVEIWAMDGAVPGT